jgi:hypothetical protein
MDWGGAVMIWTDGQNQYDIQDQNGNVINSNIKLVYKGTGGTPVSASNMNKIDNLKCDCIEGTTQVPTFTGSDITKIEHKQGAAVIRTDAFTYTSTKTTEVRTLNTGETITLEYNFDASGNFTGTVVS